MREFLLVDLVDNVDQLAEATDEVLKRVAEHAAKRDTEFDDIPKYRSAGIKLNYIATVEALQGLRDGVLLDVGFDTVAPNTQRTSALVSTKLEPQHAS